MGSPGVTTHLHYDTVDNFFSQVKGTKRFVIASPEYHIATRVFPALHPNARQSQHKIKTGHPRDVSRVFKGQCYVQYTTLQPGEILFLPSLTFHMVTAGEGADVSVGVSAMSKRPFNQGLQ